MLLLRRNALLEFVYGIPSNDLRGWNGDPYLASVQIRSRDELLGIAQELGLPTTAGRKRLSKADIAAACEREMRRREGPGRTG